MGYKDDNYSTKVCGHHPETCTCRDWDTKEEPKQTDQNGKPITYWGGLEEPKQETLEEAASRLYPEECNWREKNSFFEGAQWQVERMYSEEDMREAFKQSRQAKIFEKDMPPVHNEFEDWFEQFKKK